jgi:hypothetical protein
MQELVYLLLRINSFLLVIVCSGNVDTGVMRPEDMLGSEISGTEFGDYYVMTVLWDVT